MDPKNKYALLILALNEKDTDRQIEKLQIIYQLYPQYAFAVYQIGLAYDSKQQFD